MKVLLTGGAGYIGSHTAVELLNEGYEVVVADNFSNSSPKALARVEQITGKKVALYEIDVCNESALDKLFDEQMIDAVIHFAGLKAVGESVRVPLEYYSNNINSTISLLNSMSRHGCKKIIFSSSATVYGNPAKVPITEDMPTGGCSNPYGFTKHFIEQIIRDACIADPKLNAVLLRYFNPIGAHKSGLIGEMPDGVPNNLMPYITQVAVGIREKLSVFGNDYDTHDGTGVRDYIHVTDLAIGHIKALEHCKAGVQTFNLGTGKGYSVLDIVNSFMKVNSLDIPYVIAPRRPGDIAKCYADPTKAEKELGWAAKYDINDMCRDSWNWQSNNPRGYDE